MSSVADAAVARLQSISAASPGSLSLRVGEPDFQTPNHILEAGIRALRDGFTKYSPPLGFTTTREIIRDKLRLSNGYEPDLDDVLVTGGSSPATCIAIAATCQAGDEILVPDPGWPNYETFASVLGIKARRYALRPDNNMRPDLDELASLVNSRTRLLVVNSPSNPTGAVLSGQDTEQLVEFAHRFGLHILSDEVYEAIVFEGAACSPAAVGGADITFGCYSLSKTYAMTGWRIGYVVAPPTLRASAAALQLAINGCAPAASQKAAEAALTGPQEIVAEMCASYRRRRDKAVAALAGTDSVEVAPAGAFYLWLNVRQSGMTGSQFADYMRTEQQVLISAGAAYSTQDQHHVRVSLATAEDLLLEGISRLRSRL